MSAIDSSEVVLLERIPSNLNLADTLRLYGQRRILACVAADEFGDNRNLETITLATPSGPAAQLVTRDQMAEAVHRNRRSLDKQSRQIPGRVTEGDRGQPALWDWNLARPWLETKMGMSLPERLPEEERGTT